MGTYNGNMGYKPTHLTKSFVLETSLRRIGEKEVNEGKIDEDDSSDSKGIRNENDDERIPMYQQLECTPPDRLTSRQSDDWTVLKRNKT